MHYIDEKSYRTRDEFARRYIMYSDVARTTRRSDIREHALDQAYFWYVAYCYGKAIAIAEHYGK
jgi:hypothetical protein